MCQVSFSEPGLFSSFRDRKVAGAGASGRHLRHRRGRDRRRCCGLGRRRRLVEFLVQRLEHARGFLAAGNAEIEPRLGLAGDRVGIVVTIVTALAAVLLRHRRHHPPPQRPAFGELHAVGNRHGLVVPRRIVVGSGAAEHGSALLRRQCGRGVARQQAGEKAVEPGALRFGERRRGRNDVEPGGRGHLVHADTSASASLRSVSPSWRRANVRKVSAADWRCVR
jgi:hypothetical protein